MGILFDLITADFSLHSMGIRLLNLKFFFADVLHSFSLSFQSQWLHWIICKLTIPTDFKDAVDSHKIDHLSSLNEIGVELNRFLSLQNDPQAQEEIRVLPSSWSWSEAVPPLSSATYSTNI